MRESQDVELRGLTWPRAGEIRARQGRVDQLLGWSNDQKRFMVLLFSWRSRKSLSWCHRVGPASSRRCKGIKTRDLRLHCGHGWFVLVPRPVRREGVSFRWALVEQSSHRL